MLKRRMRPRGELRVFMKLKKIFALSARDVPKVRPGEGPRHRRKRVRRRRRLRDAGGRGHESPRWCAGPDRSRRARRAVAGDLGDARVGARAR